MKKILVVMGTRPEVIKMASVIQAFEGMPDVSCQICLTSQHRTMQDQMMSLFGFKADFDLDVMKPHQDLFYLTSVILDRLKAVYETAKPDLVLVQGDTTTSFVAALAAFYLHIPVGHIEAGLRTYDLEAPFPEEANRQLTSRLAKLHFAPTALSKRHLLQEGIPEHQIHVTGNTVIDALFWMRTHLMPERVQFMIPKTVLNLVEHRQPYVLVTGHRRENFGAGFQAICRAIRKAASHHPDWHFVYPVHLNPNVQKPVMEILDGAPNVHLIAPVDYEPFVYLMDHARFVLTDSGGVQEEAPSLGKPVLVMREVTERPEGIEAGTALLVGTDEERIYSRIISLIEDKALYDAMAHAVNPYGDGNAAARIVRHIRQALNLSPLPISEETESLLAVEKE
ncbi:MAG: UDP-N-acetylglucosamine 2-epimerase (non-hydrolyzing) [Gammaproteobacteria bacterium]|nr:UDP-N-acetylglucosamine 2-epimerase (non-hydrolyzing) [Gammaproteobacteria bacterium]